MTRLRIHDLIGLREPSAGRAPSQGRGVAEHFMENIYTVTYVEVMD